jgi:serine/threonine protein kinase
VALALGSRLGPYEIVAPLGAGGMGEVYRATDTRLGRTVAIKILPAHLSDKPTARERFEREARSISALNHPNICHLYDVGSQDGLRYLVMEYLEGETLADRLGRGPLPLNLLLKCGIELCEGLGAAHRSGVVHRDLKPGNIMLTKAGSKLLDFGLAKPSVVSDAGGSRLQTLSKPLTAEGSWGGTFQYMSPEQVEGKEVDARSDIFSLGAVLYEMLTGRRAFEGKSQLSVASAILEKEPAPISEVKPLTPQALDHAIRTCRAKDPEKRWQSVGDLTHILTGIAGSGAGAGALQRPRREVARFVRGRLLAALAARRSGDLLLLARQRGDGRRRETRGQSRRGRHRPSALRDLFVRRVRPLRRHPRRTAVHRPLRSGGADHGHHAGRQLAGRREAVSPGRASRARSARALEGRPRASGGALFA